MPGRSIHVALDAADFIDVLSDLSFSAAFSSVLTTGLSQERTRRRL